MARNVLQSQSSDCLGAGEYNNAECSELQQECQACYCTAALFSSPFSEAAYCPGNVRRYFLMQLLNIGLGGVTAVINVLLQLYSAWAVGEEVHSSRTRAQATSAQAQFAAQFLNTVAVGVRPCMSKS